MSLHAYKALFLLKNGDLYFHFLKCCILTTGFPAEGLLAACQAVSLAPEMNFLEFNDNNSEIERDVPSPRSREAIIWMLGNKSYATQKKKKPPKKQKSQSPGWQTQADIRHMGTDSLSVIGGLWCLFSADSPISKRKSGTFTAEF